MTLLVAGATIPVVTACGEDLMATTLADDVKHEDWSEPRPMAAADGALTRAEALWTFFGLTLLGAFLTFVAARG